jgi:ubiquitin-activating enzyme E1
VRVTGPFTFTIEDTRGYSPFVRGGYVQQVKVPKDVTFKPLEALLGPQGVRDVVGCCTGFRDRCV